MEQDELRKTLARTSKLLLKAYALLGDQRYLEYAGRTMHMSFLHMHDDADKNSTKTED